MGNMKVSCCRENKWFPQANDVVIGSHLAKNVHRIVRNSLIQLTDPLLLTYASHLLRFYFVSVIVVLTQRSYEDAGVSITILD